MAIQRYRYCVSEITQNGETCKSPTYQWDVPACMANPCEEGNCIEVELDLVADPDCNSLTVTIDCADCAKCPPITKTVTFCDGNDDCDSCHICTDGVCIDQCPSDKFCVTGECVDCTLDAHCEFNQVCVAGECVCPPGLVKDSFGNCVECLNDGACDVCEACVGGSCEPKCPSNLCLAGGCKECLIDGDCAGANVCCGASNTCECCDGFRWDPATDTCVVDTECISNSDCGACEYCNAGSCAPISCPAGKVVSNIPGNCCVNECDCDAPDCDGNACVPLDASTCYCNPCTGGCDENSDCGEGCICQGGDCVANTCYGACMGAGDCGPNCGCLDGICVPCTNGNCADDSCNQILGCECDGGDCKASPCKGDCDFNECGQGCGCKDKNCVKCSNVSCTNNIDCPFGCTCNGGICQDSGCDDVLCVDQTDCGQGCGCDGGICQPCNSFSCAECSEVNGCVCQSGFCVDDNDDTCDDVLSITKDDDNCDATLSLDTDRCCECPDVDMKVAISSVSNAGADATYNGVFSFTRNGVALASSGIDNELQYFVSDPPSVVVKNHYVYKEAEDFGAGYVIKAGAPALEDNNSTTVVFGATGVTASTAFSIKKVDSVFASGGVSYKVIKTFVTVEILAGDKVVTGDSCDYDLTETKIYETQSTFAPSANYTTAMDQETICATPVFNLKKSDSSTFPVGSTTTTKFYADPDNDGDGVFKYTLVDYTNDGLEQFKYYALTSSCSCDDEFKYGCNLSGEVANKLTFCSIKTLGDVTVDDCAKVVTFNDAVLIDCDVVEQSPTKPTFDLYINGEVHTAGIAAVGTTIIAAATTYTTTNGQIESIKLVQNNMACEDCELTKTFVPNLTPCDPTCPTATSLAIDSINVTNACTTGTVVTVSGGFGAYTGRLYQGEYVGIPPAIVTPFRENVTLAGITNLVDGTYTVVVKDAVGCEVSQAFTVAGCCDLSVTTASFACTVNDAEIDLTLNISGSDTYSVKLVNNTTGAVTTVEAGDTAANINAGSPYIVNPLPNGRYTLAIEDVSAGAIEACEYNKEFDINCCTGVYTADWNPVTAEVDLEKDGVTYTGPVKVYLGSTISGSPIYSGLATAINHTTLWTEGETYSILFEDTTGCTATDTVTISACSVLSTTPSLVCDSTTYTFTFSNISGSNSGAFNFTATDGTVSTAAPVAMTDLGGGSFSVVLTIGAEIPSEFVATPITYTIIDSAKPSCTKVGTVSTVFDCAGDLAVSYSCTDGIVVTEGGVPYVGNIVIDGGAPVAYAAGIYLTDGTHSVKIGAATFSLTSISCCSTLSVVIDSIYCDAAGIKADYTITGGSGLYNIAFTKSGGGTVGTAVTGASAGSYTKALTSISNGQSLIITATDANYSPYVHGTGAGSNCTDADSDVVNVCNLDPVTVNIIGCDGTLQKLQLLVDAPECGVSSITGVRYGKHDSAVVTATPGVVSTWYNATFSSPHWLAEMSVFTLCGCGGVYANSWSVPFGLAIEVTYNAATCGEGIVEYIYLPANTGPTGCESCTGFNCEV